MDMFTLHEFLEDYCHNDPVKLQGNKTILLQALKQDRVISRYSYLLKDKIEILQAYLQDFDSIPGYTRNDSSYLRRMVLNAKYIFLHILICLLSIPPNNNKQQFSNYDSAHVEQIAIFNNVSIEEYSDTSSIATSNVYYYSNIYHLILAWYVSGVKSCLYYEQIYDEYYDYLIKENSLINTLQKSKIEINLLWVNYLAENPTYIDLSAQAAMYFTDLHQYLPADNIKREILVRHNFYNFHSYKLYIYETYHENMEMKNRHLDFARLNFLIKMNWLPRRADVLRDYQIVDSYAQMSENDFSSAPIEVSANIAGSSPTSTHVKMSELQSTIYELGNKILLAHNGQLVVDGPVLGLWHVAKYGLVINAKYVQLLLQSVAQISAGPVERKYYYLPFLLKMGVSLPVITSLQSQQMWATIITGVVPIGDNFNLVYDYQCDEADLFIGNVDIFSIREHYYINMIKRELITPSTVINRFNMVAYPQVRYSPKTKSIYLCTYIYNKNKLPIGEFYSLYPVLTDRNIMDKWIIDISSEIKLNSQFPDLPYIDYTLSTAELAAKYGIANIYARNLVMLLIQVLKRKEQNVYYRTPTQKLADGKILSSTGQEIGINMQQANEILSQTNNSYFLRINFISIVNALNLYDRTDQVLFQNRWKFVIDNHF